MLRGGSCGWYGRWRNIFADGVLGISGVLVCFVRGVGLSVAGLV